MTFRPMLAAKPDSMDQIKFPVMASPKLDGIRCLVIGGRLMSRSLKEIPNNYIQEIFKGLPDGLDGELILGDAWDDPYRRTVSAVMSEDGEPKNIQYCVFDNFKLNLPFQKRYESLWCAKEILAYSRLTVVQHQIVDDLGALENIEQIAVAKGYEGLMVRSLGGPYKQGRSTVKEGYLLKIKRFLDGEAEIVGFEERMHNGNVATKNALDRTERSTHQANLVGRGDLGALVVRDIKTGVEFNVGTGFNDTDRAAIWESRVASMGRVIKYRYFPTGAKDKPRFPTFEGFRDARDMSE